MFLVLLLACTPKSEGDLDGDGVFIGDCAPEDGTVFPGAAELCNGVDDNCDGATDEGLLTTWYVDADLDGYGSTIAIDACTIPDGFVDNADDCDDMNLSIHPGATEICNGVDDDCDGVADVSGLWYADLDGDGYGDPASEQVTCLPEPGWISDNSDCDDADPAAHPGATEVCDTADNDCDGTADAGYEQDWYSDEDGDGYGWLADHLYTCTPPTGWVLDATDCQPYDASARPGAPERCNDIDDNCDGVVDEGSDIDGDGYRNTTCDGGDDCEDGDPTIHPDADELCEDGIDQDCTGSDVACGFDPETELALADALLYNPSPDGDAGRELALGDTDGDGVEELLIGAIYTNGYAGAGWLVSPTFSGTTALDTVGWSITGTQGGGEGGRSVSLGDVDGDGLDDVGLGSPFSNPNGVYVFFGPVTSDLTFLDADVNLSGGAYAGHGHDLADVDGDGIADAVVGDYGLNKTGGISVVYGPLSADVDLDTTADAVLLGEAGSTYAGRVVHVGDFNGDGVGDIVSGGPSSLSASYAGAVYVVYGPPPEALDLADADGHYEGASSNAYAGVELASGDVDNDGLEDLGVGAYHDLTSGREGVAYVVLGPCADDTDLSTSDIIIEGAYVDEYVGSGMAIDDIDADGKAELLIGARGAAGSTGAGTGVSFLFWDPPFGSSDAYDADVVFLGTSSADSAGAGVALSDLDDDGLGDVLIGAPGNATGGSTAGGVFLVRQVR